MKWDEGEFHISLLGSAFLILKILNTGYLIINNNMILYILEGHQQNFISNVNELIYEL